MSTIQGGSVQRNDMLSFDKVSRVQMPVQNGVKEMTSTKDLGAKDPSSIQEKKLSMFDVSKLNEEEKQKLEEELKKLNDSLTHSGKLLKFKYDEDAKTSYVEVIDAATQEVVASMPPEFLIDLSVKMKEIIGIFLDKKL